MTLIADIGTLLLAYGPVVLFLVSVIASFGLPAPATLGLLAAGALASTGAVSATGMAVAGIIGTVIGDHLAYLLAARASARVHALPVAKHLARAEALLARWGVWQVFVSRWFLPAVLTPATNYFAGLSGYPLLRFTPAVIAGEVVYVIGYMALGAALSAQVEQVNKVIGRGTLIALVVMGVVIVLLIRRQRRRPPAATIEPDRFD